MNRPCAFAFATALLAACGTSTTRSLDPTVVRPGEQWIAYQLFQDNGQPRSDLRLVRPDGSGDHALFQTRPGDQGHPDWSPDGERLVFDVNGTQLWTANADGTNAAKLPIDCSAPCVLLDEAAWSPDGMEIAFLREEYPPGQLPFNMVQSIDLASNEVRTLYRPPDLQGANHPRWSPDGESIVVELSKFATAESNSPGGSAVVTLDVTDPAAEPFFLTEWSMFAAYPDWSWATDTIVFTTYDLGRRYSGDIADPSAPSDLYTVKPDGTGLQQLTHNPSGTTLIRNDTASGPLSTQPTWSPDGTSIVFVQVDGAAWPGWGMATMNADGTRLASAVGETFQVGTHPRLRPGV